MSGECNIKKCDCSKKIPVRWEFYEFNQSRVLVLEQPAEVIFQNLSTIVGNEITINNQITLQTLKDNLSGIATKPWELALKNNDCEIDETRYQINLTDGVLRVIVKYFV